MGTGRGAARAAFSSLNVIELEGSGLGIPAVPAWALAPAEPPRAARASGSCWDLIRGSTGTELWHASTRKPKGPGKPETVRTLRVKL